MRHHIFQGISIAALFSLLPLIPCVAQQSADDKAREHLRDKILEITAEQQSLKYVFSFLSDNTDGSINVDWESLEVFGVDKSIPVTVSVEKTTIGATIDTILADLHKTYPRFYPQVLVCDGKIQISAVFTDSVPAHPEKGPFLFCYFNGNGDGLHLSSSTDGLKFTPLNKNNVYLRPDVGNQLMRDPCLRQGPNGMYHVVFTTGWWDKGFGVASSPDLVHWSEQKYVEVNKNNPTAINTWAPELFYDDAKHQWLILWATTIPEKFIETQIDGGRGVTGPNHNQSTNHRIYYVTTKDFETYSDTKLLVDPGFNCIDATMIKVPANSGPISNRYVMVLKDETAAPVPKKNLRTLDAISAEGPWSWDGGNTYADAERASPPISHDWVEGPSIAQVGDFFYCYYDEYTQHTYGAIRTKDFIKWEVVKDNFSFPQGASHGTVFPVTQATYDRLTQAAPFELPEVTRRDPESTGPPPKVFGPTSAPATRR